MRVALILVLLALFAACGSKGTEKLAASPTPTEAPSETPAASAAAGATQAPCAQATPAPPEQLSSKPDSKPDVKVPAGQPPCALVSQDIYVGTGAEAQAGATVTVQYVGVSWSTGKQFDASWDRGQPATFSLNQVVKGWGEGIPGMKEGGRRRLVIPPDLGYGAQGYPPDIAPNETLIFVIDLIKVG